MEADGPIHASREEYDRARDHFLFCCGVVTLRFSNDEILGRPRAVVRTIVREAHRLAPGYRHPLPPGEGRGEG